MKTIFEKLDEINRLAEEIQTLAADMQKLPFEV